MHKRSVIQRDHCSAEVKKFCGRSGHNQGRAADTLMSPAEWISSHNFAGLSPCAVDYSEKPIAFSALSSVRKIHFRQLYELLRMAKTVKLTKMGVA